MTTTNSSTQNKQPAQKVALSKLIWVTPLAIVATSIANLILYFAASRIFPTVGAWSGASSGQIIGATIVYLFIGAIVLAIISRVSSRPARHFRIVATIGLIVSMFLPLSAWFGYGAEGVPPADTATAITLSLMHVVAFAISVPMFTRLVLGESR